MSLPIETEILNGLVFDREFAKAALPHLKDEYFTDDGMRTIVQLAKNYIVKYNGQPTIDALAIDLQAVKDINQDQFETSKNILAELKAPEVSYQWLIDRAEGFCQDRALYLGIMQAIQIVDGNEKAKSGISKGAIPDILQKALGVNFDRSIGHDYLDNANDRYQYYHNKESLIPFDLEMLNRITGGGLAKKTLTVWTGAPNAGKTLVLCHCAAANMRLGYKVLYITMEMAEERIAQRIDANLLRVPINDLKALSKADFIERVEHQRKRTLGDIVVKEFPTGNGNVNHFKHLLSELAQKKDFVPDITYVDYMNICSSARYAGSKEVNSYSSVKSIAEELRGMAVEFNMPVVTATQFNRTGSDSSDPSMTDTSDSFGTPMTADLQLAIITNPDLDSQGKLMFKQLKNRDNSVSDNSRILVKVNRSQMRLYDDDDNISGLPSYDAPAPDKNSRIVIPRTAFGDLDFGSDELTEA